MTEQGAIDVLDEVSSKYHGTRQDHVMIQAALQTLRRAVEELDVLRRERAEQEEPAEEAEPAEGDPTTH